MTNSKTSPFSQRPHAPVRVGLVGVTGYGSAYFEALTRLVDLGRVAWGAVTIINPKDTVEQIAFFQERNVPIFGDYLEMLEEGQELIDWVCIPTGIGWHTQMVVESLARGYQVTVEKPLAPTLQDVATIQAAEKRSGIGISVGFQYAYQQETWDIKERLLSGEIGKVERIDCLALWPRMRSYYARNKWSGRLHDGRSWILDSPLHNALCHLINLILFWSGKERGKEADIVRLQAEAYRSKPIESYDTVRSVATMDSGIEAAVVLSHSTCQRYDPEIRIRGEKGEIFWRFIGDYEVEVDGVRRSYPKLDQISVRDHMFDNVLDRIEGKSARICTSDLARGTVKWVNTVHDTAEIQEIPPAYRKAVCDEAGEVVDTVCDLEYFALRSFYERKSFQELGAPWAVEPSVADTSDYEAFLGRFCADAQRGKAARKLAK
ncbi:Gfo/Idh/MocA family oxidoreductase [Pelagicoccus sp. SDUM812005]|uniref:Gfo/Idh/MocA family protein n=1 Tax=Pelagicoccus sp. SDUM812005 TaxID=3041257 RepID=UPI00280E1412|nr:Gfo/Idh/MocA family oxidoreductase [Pelagicoccus sp. SDUM812005]MDQ8183658.1 Gfo/Idh/MocA family oxidoreductase [Pelagicoccus sp. SDUM812005]